MDLPPMDHYFFDKSAIALEVMYEEKPTQRPEMPEQFFTWSLPLPPSLQALAAQPWFDPSALLRSRARAQRAAFTVLTPVWSATSTST